MPRIATAIPGPIHSLASDRLPVRWPYSPASSRLLASFTSSLLCGFELVFSDRTNFSPNMRRALLDDSDAVSSWICSRVVLVIGLLFCIDRYKIKPLDKSLSNGLFTHRYEIRNRTDTARASARLRFGRGLGTRDARFLGQRLRRRFALKPDASDAH